MTRRKSVKRKPVKMTSEEVARRTVAALYRYGRVRPLNITELIGYVAPGLTRGRIYAAMNRAVELSVQLHPGWVISVGNGYRLVDRIDQETFRAESRRYRQAETKRERIGLVFSVAPKGSALEMYARYIATGGNDSSMLDMLEGQVEAEYVKPGVPE